MNRSTEKFDLAPPHQFLLGLLWVAVAMQGAIFFPSRASLTYLSSCPQYGYNSGIDLGIFSTRQHIELNMRGLLKAVFDFMLRYKLTICVTIVAFLFYITEHAPQIETVKALLLWLFISVPLAGSGFKDHAIGCCAFVVFAFLLVICLLLVWNYEKDLPPNFKFAIRSASILSILVAIPTAMFFDNAQRRS